MKFRNIILLLSNVVLIVSCNKDNRNLETTERCFDKIKHEGDNAKLTLFLSQMPKGGDLHHHYSGALYAETYLDWAAKKDLRINTSTWRLDTCQADITIDSLKRNNALYRKVLETWSDENFNDNFHIQEPPDEHFFNTFGYFGHISKAYYHNGMEEIKEEAEKENVQYIETMFNFPQVHIKPNSLLNDSLENCQHSRDTLHLYQLFNSLVLSIRSDSGYDKMQADYLKEIYACHEGIDDSGFTMRFQAYAVRTIPPENVFAMLYGCFDAVSRDKSSLLVGVNIVAPENNYISMRDYWLHMEMFRFLEKKFPTVKADLHAGELCLGMVKPQDLAWHIHDAIFIANARRIGHGVDIAYETEAPAILKKMKSDSIAVEINLTSNEFILGVKGNDHPVKLYYDAGVPVVISTDDAGVSRNNLTSQYVLLAERYHFSYKQIKAIVFNSIKYSFLGADEKSRLTEKLNKRFESFEAEVANDYKNSR